MRGLVVLVLVAFFGCGPTTRNNNNNDGTGPECESDGAHRCVGSTYQVCAGGAWNPGQHKISCPNGCGLLVYGYSDAVSYMFAGGLDLKKIVIN
jgi:hypothetical protein